MARTRDNESSSPRQDDGQELDERPLRGRRGGTTTVKPRMIRKTLWVDREVEAALRLDAFESGQSESELVRRALRAAYGLD